MLGARCSAVKILLNFIPLKSGGGVQVGLDFIEQAKQHGLRHEWFLVATSGTPIAACRGSSNFHVAKVIRNNLAARLWFEHIGCKALLRSIKPSLVYTQFGPHWPGVRTINVVGCAYSNLFYPEVDFWGNLPFLERVLRKAVDVFRGRRLRTAGTAVQDVP